MKNKRNSSILIILLMLSLLFSFVSLTSVAQAANLQAIQQSAQFGGKFYCVKVFYHAGETATYYLVGNESGLQIYTIAAAWRDSFPTETTTYAGGASGRGIPNFKTGVDATTISSTEYAFYADGEYLYAIDISDSDAISSAADSIAITNVRAVKVASINTHYYAFALAYIPGAPGTTKLYIIDIDDPTDMELLGNIDLDTDTENPNNTGGCAMDFLGDLDGDGTSDDPYLFIADGTEGIKAVDLSSLYTYASRTMPTTGDLTSTETNGTAQGIDVVRFGSTLYAFVADGAEGLKIFDVTDPTNMPTDDDDKTGAVNFTYASGYTGQAYDVKVLGTTVFVANGDNGVQVVDVSDIDTPVDITLGYSGAADQAYIDSTGAYNRLNGTAYGLDFDFASLKPNPIVAWGEAGLVKTDIELDDAGIDATSRIVLGGNISQYIYDGTYIWALDANKKLNRIDPSDMSKVTTTNNAFQTTCNIISLGDYIYGAEAVGAVVNGDNIARIAKTNFATLAATLNPSLSGDTATDRGVAADAGSHFILKLYTDGTNVFFLDDDATNSDEGEIGRLTVADFAEATGITESAAAFFDPGTTTEMVICNGYIFGVKTADQTTVCQIATSFSAAGTATDDDQGTLGGGVNVVKLATDGTYVFGLGNNGKLSKFITSAFGVGGSNDRITTTAAKFSATAATPYLFIQGDYVYSHANGAGNEDVLARVAISGFAAGSSVSSSAFTHSAGEINFITGDGQDIYLTNTTGLVAKIAVDRFGEHTGNGTVDADGTEADGALFQNGEDIVVGDGYAFGADNLAATTMRKVSFRATESNHTVATNSADAHFAGYAKDLALYINTGGADYVYMADGEKGVVRFTVTDPTAITNWTSLPFTDATVAADFDVTDPEDINDARGIDVTSTNSLVLVADGSGGVKLVVPGVTALETDTAVADGDGYITQSTMGTASGTAEDIKYFTFDKSTDTDHEYAVVANGSAGVVILDINDNNDGNLGDMDADVVIDTDGYAYGVAVDTENDYVYVADGSNGLVIIDLDPNDLDDDITLAELLDGEDNAYTAGSSYNLRAVALDDPTDPTYAYLAYGSKGVIILDISDPTDPTVTDTYPGSGLVDGEAYDLDYNSSTYTLYVAMSDGTILSLDVTDPENIILRGGLDTYGKALGIAYGDVDAGGAVVPHLFIANGSGGFLTAAIKTQPHITTVLPNIQTVNGGDTIKIIGSGFDNTTTVTITDGTNSTTIAAGDVTDISSFEITFAAPASPSGLSGTFDVTVTRSSVSDTLDDGLEYLPAGNPIIAMAAPDEGDGIASSGGLVPVDLILHENGSAEVTSVTAKIKYNITQLSVATDVSGSVSSSVFDINDDLEKTVYMMIIDSNPLDNYKTLNIIIYSDEAGVNAPIPDGTNMGTVYFTVLSANTSDITLTLDSSTDGGVSQQTSTSLGDYVNAYGSAVDIYVKPAPIISCTYTEDTFAAGYSADTFGPFTITAYEAFDSTDYIEDAEVTFSVPANALVDADDPNATAATAFTITTGTLSSSTATSITVLTNSSGQAVVKLNVGTVAGEYSMTISGEYNDSALTGTPTTPISEDFTITAETTADDPNDSISLSYTPTNPTTGGTVTITATAYDRYDNLLGSENITFTTSQGTLSSAIGTTNTSGQATVDLTLANTVSSHTVTATYDTSTTASLVIAPAGPDVNADGSWSSSSDIQTAINYHLNWTDLSTAPKPTGQSYVPGDTNQNNRFDLNEVIALINLALGI